MRWTPHPTGVHSTCRPWRTAQKQRPRLACMGSRPAQLTMVWPNQIKKIKNKHHVLILERRAWSPCADTVRISRTTYKLLFTLIISPLSSPVCRRHLLTRGGCIKTALLYLIKSLGVAWLTFSPKVCRLFTVTEIWWSGFSRFYFFFLIPSILKPSIITLLHFLLQAQSLL